MPRVEGWSVTHAALAFLSWPEVSHSFTPEGLSRMLGRAPADGGCVALRVAPAALPERLRALAAAGCRGVNLTTPLKTAVLPELDALDEHARRCGAANGVAFREGRLLGTQSDLPGLRDCFDHDLEGGIAGRRVLVVGAGGAARAAVLAAGDRGAAEIVLACRDAAAGAAVQADLERRNGPLPLRVTPLENAEHVAAALAAARLVVQATPVGLRPDDAPLLALEGPLAPDLVVMDLIYRPARTALLRSAEARGVRVLNGWPLWVHQAEHLFRFLAGHPPAVRYSCREQSAGAG